MTGEFNVHTSALLEYENKKEKTMVNYDVQNCMQGFPQAGLR